MQDTQRRRNIKSHIDQIIKGYNTEPAKGLVHGFQKDAIQNSWGHRKNKRGTDWKLIFRLINNDKGNFLVVEDCGCSGLTGKNYSQDELSEMMSRDEFLGENEKLARFSTLNNSGGNQTSAGTYGRGKQMYQAVSKDLKYYFDSLTKDGNYVANYINSEENTKIKAYEDHEAKSYILEETLLSEKNTIGTRVIITNPIDDIVEAIKSKSILKDIEETWWRILQKYSATIELYDNDTYLGKANVPEFYLKEMSDVMYKEYENYTSSAGYVVKRLGIGYCKDPIPEELSNISYYRKDMKIGEVYWLSDLPVDEEHKSHIWGFIEFDDNGNWETELKNNENLEHYGPEKRSKKDFQELKKTIKSKLQDFLLLKGLVKKDKKSDPNQELNDFANDLADFLKDSNFDFSWDNGKEIKKIHHLILQLIRNIQTFQSEQWNILSN